MAFIISVSCQSCGRAALINHAPSCITVRVANVWEAGAELTACRDELTSDLTAAHGHASQAFTALAGLPTIRAMAAELTALLGDGLIGLAEDLLDDIDAVVCAGTVAV